VLNYYYYYYYHYHHHPFFSSFSSSWRTYQHLCAIYFCTLR